MVHYFIAGHLKLVRRIATVKEKIPFINRCFPTSKT